jgi:hypothetical protein
MVSGLIPVAILSLMNIRFQDGSLPVRIMDYAFWMGLICLTERLAALSRLEFCFLDHLGRTGSKGAEWLLAGASDGPPLWSPPTYSPGGSPD